MEEKINNSPLTPKEVEAGSSNSEKQATSRQLIAILFILALATKMFLMPIYMLRAAGRDGYILLAIDCALDLVALVLYLIAMKLSPDDDFFKLLNSVLGKVGSRIAVALVGLFLFFKLNISTAETLTFYSNNVFSDFKTPIMSVVLLVFLVAVGKHTLRSILRLNELLVPLIIVCILVLITIVVVTGFDLGNIMPTLQNPTEFKRSLLNHASWLGDFTPVVLFIGRTKQKPHTRVFAGVSGVVGSLVAVFFGIVMCAAFGNAPNLADSSTNLSNILQFSLGNVYGRIDLFSSVLWSLGAFIENALLFYCTCRCFSYVIGKNAHFWISIGFAVALYVLQVFAFTDPTVFATVAESGVTSAVCLCFTFAVPILALSCALINHGRTQNKGENPEPSANNSVGARVKAGE